MKEEEEKRAKAGGKVLLYRPSLISIDEMTCRLIFMAIPWWWWWAATVTAPQPLLFMIFSLFLYSSFPSGFSFFHSFILPFFLSFFLSLFYGFSGVTNKHEMAEIGHRLFRFFLFHSWPIWNIFELLWWGPIIGYTDSAQIFPLARIQYGHWQEIFPFWFASCRNSRQEEKVKKKRCDDAHQRL